MNPDATGPPAPSADALVVFGATGDLAHKKTFPALYATCRRAALKVPVIGVAASTWSVEQSCARARECVGQAGSEVDPTALDRLLSALQYISGDYKEAATSDARSPVLNAARWRLARHRAGGSQ